MKTEAPLKIIRIFKLLQNLSEFPPKNVEKLAQVIDVSPKTIYKDLHTLESLGYETDKDHSHRYQLKHHRQIEYHLDDTEKKTDNRTYQRSRIKYKYSHEYHTKAKNKHLS